MKITVADLSIGMVGEKVVRYESGKYLDRSRRKE